MDAEKIKVELRAALIRIKNALSGFFTPGRLSKIGLVFGIFILVVILFDQLIMPWYTKHGEALAVANTLGKRYEAAKELLELQGLEVVKAGEKHDPNLPFGYIVDQNPRPNRLVKKGRRVYLTISVGEREVLVPELIGFSETNARERLKSHGLRLGEIEYQYVPNELADVVVEQSRRSNSLVKSGSAIDIVVSLGEPSENVIVPFVLGKTLDVAKREIQKAGLTVGRITYKLNNEFLPNTVIEQSLESGLRVEHGDTIDLLVTTVRE